MNPPSLRFLQPESLLADFPRVPAERAVVHVWPFLLSGLSHARAQCEEVLSQAERERARRFRGEALQESFVFAHGLMRMILGAYCAVTPKDLGLIAGEFGKPAIAPACQPASGPVSFNLSHSRGRALLAVSHVGEVGADIECEARRTDVLGIASSYFFGPEYEAISGAGEAARQETFFRYWVAKEAVLKAQGTGLRVPLDSFHVRFDPGAATARIESLDERCVSSGWFVRCLPCEAGWHGAVAARTPDWQLKVIGAA